MWHICKNILSRKLNCHLLFSDYIQVGNFNRNLTEECTPTECFKAQKLAIAEIIVHDGFTKYAQDNDIALVKVGREITFGVSAQPVCLPLYESMLDGLHLKKDTKFLSAGWGSLTLSSINKHILSLCDWSLLSRECSFTIF